MGFTPEGRSPIRRRAREQFRSKLNRGRCAARNTDPEASLRFYPLRLPAAATATAAAAAATVVTAAIATAMVTTAAATAAMEATAATAATFALTRFVDLERAAIDLRAIHRRDCCLRLGVRRHLDEREATRATGFPIHHDVNIRHLATILLERSAQNFRRGGVIEIADVQTLSHSWDLSETNNELQARLFGRTSDRKGPSQDNELANATNQPVK